VPPSKIRRKLPPTIRAHAVLAFGYGGVFPWVLRSRVCAAATASGNTRPSVAKCVGASVMQ
jgi:hypothetical protein